MGIIQWITEEKSVLLESLPVLLLGYFLWYAIFENQDEE
jgi:hypothetical protein